VIALQLFDMFGYSFPILEHTFVVIMLVLLPHFCLPRIKIVNIKADKCILLLKIIKNNQTYQTVVMLSQKKSMPLS
jgi:hypothetical protein